MAKPKERLLSAVSQDALLLLGQHVREASLSEVDRRYLWGRLFLNPFVFQGQGRGEYG